MALNPITSFREKRRSFYKRLTEIENLIYGTSPLVGAYLAEAQKLREEAQSVRKKLDGVETMIRAAEKTFGLTEGSGLGVLPAIPIVIISAIAGVTYLVGKFMDKSAEFLSRNSYVKKRTAEGASVATAAQEFAAQNPPTGGLFGDAAQLVWPLAIGAGFLFLASRRKR